MELKNKIKDKKYKFKLENVKTDIKKLIEIYLKKKDELYKNLIENKIFNISDTNFKYIEDVILYELHKKSLNTIKYNTEKIFYEFFIEFYKTLIKILDKIEPDSEEAPAEAAPEPPAEVPSAELSAEPSAEPSSPEPSAKAEVEAESAESAEAAAKKLGGGRKKIKTKRIKKFKRRKTRRKN